MCDVFVRGIDFNTTKQQMQEHFSPCGEIVDLYFQRRGSAIVKFSSESEAERAVADLNGGTMPGSERWLDVKINDESRDPARKEPRSWEHEPRDRGFKRSAPTGEAPWKIDDSAKRARKYDDFAGADDKDVLPGVFVNGFDFGTTEEQVREHFLAAGEVVEISMRKGAAVVSYATEDEAGVAVEVLHKSTITGNERYLDVSLLDKGKMRRDSRRNRSIRPRPTSAPVDNEEGDWEGAEDALEATEGWTQALAEAWRLFCDATPKGGRTLSAWLGGLPSGAQAVLRTSSKKA